MASSRTPIETKMKMDAGGIHTDRSALDCSTRYTGLTVRRPPGFIAGSITSSGVTLPFEPTRLYQMTCGICDGCAWRPRFASWHKKSLPAALA